MTRFHACPGGCHKQIPAHHLACGACWGRLPAQLAIAISATYRNRRGNPLAHRQAIQAAIAWYHQNPRETTHGKN